MALGVLCKEGQEGCVRIARQLLAGRPVTPLLLYVVDIVTRKPSPRLLERVALEVQPSVRQHWWHKVDPLDRTFHAGLSAHLRPLELVPDEMHPFRVLTAPGKTHAGHLAAQFHR